MPPASQHNVDVKLVGTTIGAVIGGIILLGVLPFLIFGSFLFFRTLWRVMFKDRAQYLLNEKTRAAWNVEARREARLRYNAMALVRHWGCKTGIVTRGSPMELSVLVSSLRCACGVTYVRLLTHCDLKVHKNYFPVRQYHRHVILKAFLNIPTRIRFWWFDSGPDANLQITKSEWEEARARAMGECNIELQSFEQIFWKDQPPPYSAIVGDAYQV